MAYEIPSENITEVLPGLRHRFGTPITKSIEGNGSSTQQQWIWHTGEDVIAALKEW